MNSKEPKWIRVGVKMNVLPGQRQWFGPVFVILSPTHLVHQLVLRYGSVTCWYGSGSTDPYHWPTDQDPALDPAIFVSDLQDGNEHFFPKFFCLFLFFEATFTSFFNDKSHKGVRNGGNQGFSYNFCLMIEGSGAGSVPRTRPDPGCPKTYESGSATLTPTLCRF